MLYRLPLGPNLRLNLHPIERCIERPNGPTTRLLSFERVYWDYNLPLSGCVMARVRAVLACALLLAVVGFAQDNNQKTGRVLPADTDPGLSSELTKVEQNFGETILRKDAQRLEQIVAPEFTLRISDYPDDSLPRAMWLQTALHELNAEGFEHHHDAARKLADDLAVVSLLFTAGKATMKGQDATGSSYLVDLWKKRGGMWQIIARYGSRIGDRPAPPALKLPPPGDRDPQLTDELRKVEQQLGEAALHRDTTVLETLVGPEYALHLGDAPELSVPRAAWIDNSRPQASHPYKLESFQERYHAARKLNDNLAVVSLLLSQKATADGVDRSGDFYLVDIWKKTGDKWQIMARYSTPVAKTTAASTPSK
jgi:Domain of unknown function (DUF4440)